MPVNGLARLILALKAEECILMTALIQAGHPCFFFIDAFRIGFELRGLREGIL